MNVSDMIARPPAGKSRFLEELSIGDRFTTRSVSITEDEILDFARRFDPQPFHLDPSAAARSIYGGLIASGFHTVSTVFGLFIELGVLAESSMGSPGMDELKWHLPVRPGDSLRAEVEVVEVRSSLTKPDRGIVRLRYHGYNQNGDEVITFTVNHLLKRKRA
jgi:acyl dehydratase